MDAAANATPQAAEPQPPDGTAANVARRASTWSWACGWTLIGIFVIYPLSMMPAYVAVLILRRHGIEVFAAYRFAYWPILWLLDNVELFHRLDRLIEPMLRGLVR